MPRNRRRLRLALAASFAFVATAGPAFAGQVEDERARNALRVLVDIQQIPESAIPDKLLDEGRAIVVIPDTLKAGLIIGGRRGHGLLSVKTPEGTWSNPVFVKLTGGSIGFQAGVQSSDVVLVFRGQRGLDNLVNGKFTLGADAGVAAGPVGRNAAASTDGQLKAEIWSWSRARGLFAGVALDGAVLQIDDDANLAAYGANTTPRMIFEGRPGGAPSGDVVAFRDQLEEATASARVARGDTSPPKSQYVPPAPATYPANSAAPVHAEPAPAPQQGGFEPVPSDTPVRAEPLPSSH